MVSDSNAGKRTAIAVLIVIGFIVLGIAVYSNTFESAFHFDDNHYIVENKHIRDISEIGDIWTYLPRRFLGTFSFALNYHFHQLDVSGYHIVNLVIHICASLFACWLAWLLMHSPVLRRQGVSDRSAAFVAVVTGLVFLVHPLQTQAVTYIVQRLASCAAMWYLLALSFYLKWRYTGTNTSSPYLPAAGISAVLGLLTKETVYTLPLMIMVIEVYFMSDVRERFKKMSPAQVSAVLGGLAGFGLVVLALLSFDTGLMFEAAESQRYADPLLTPWVYFLTQFRVYLTYIRLLFFPANQNLDYNYPAAESLFEPRILLSAAVVFGLVFLAVRWYRKRKILSFAIVWFFVSLSVESTFKPLSNVIFEHRLYLPMFGFGFSIACLLARHLWKSHRRRAYILTGMLVVILSILTYRRNEVWKTDHSLWSDVVEKSPDKARPHNNLGETFIQMGAIDEAVREYETALSIHPGYTLALNNLGNALVIKGNNERAIQLLRRAIEIRPGFSDAYYNLGIAFAANDQYDQALAAYDRARQLNPDNSMIYNNIGNIYGRMGQPEEATAYFRRAVAIEPSNAEAYNNLGTALNTLNRLGEAESAIRHAISLRPRFVEAYFNLGNVLVKKGDVERAVHAYRTALRINPHFTPAIRNLERITSQ